MAAPELPEFTENVPTRSKPVTFNNDMAAWLAWIVPLIPSMNVALDWINTKASEILVNLSLTDDNVVASAANVVASELAAQRSSADANYIGLWSAQAGSFNAGISVGHGGAFWRLNENVADITTEEPTPTNTKWQFSSGTRWVQPAVLPKNSQSFITTVAATDKALPAMIANDFLYVKNSASSTDKLRLLNTTYTINSSIGSITSSDNLVLAVGEAVSLVCVSPTVLEIVK